MIYNEIINFCKVRDTDRKTFSNRAKFVIALLKKHNIQHTVIRTKSTYYKKYFYNILAFGTSDKYLSAHYDVVNINVDNANDNSASVINAIAYKLINPSINLLILDGEEPPYMGAGSNIVSKYLKHYNKNVKWILNLELTGKGSTFFIDNAKTSLADCIMSNFPEAFSVSTPFNDSVNFRRHGFVSNVITVVDKDEKKGGPDMKILYHSHGPKDSLSNISTEDMRNFVENVVDKIVKSC